MTLPTDVHQLRDVVPLLQASVSPVTVISGVGLLILSMTNRYGRVIDRVRTLLKEFATLQAGNVPTDLPLAAPPSRPQPDPHQPPPPAEHFYTPQQARARFVYDQINVLFRRARLLRSSILFALVSLFFVAVTISLLFSGLILRLPVALYTTNSFLLSLLMLLLSLIFFIQDISLSLHALRLEIDQQMPYHWLSSS
jgi:hypothetical protein